MTDLNWVRCIYLKEQTSREGSIESEGSRAQPGASWLHTETCLQWGVYIYI